VQGRADGDGSRPTKREEQRKGDQARSSIGICLVDFSTASFHLGFVNKSDLADMQIRFESVEAVFNCDCFCSKHLKVVKVLCGKYTKHSKIGSQYWDPQLAIKLIQKTTNWDAFPEVLE
jgi:hypothetical protein